MTEFRPVCAIFMYFKIHFSEFCPVCAIPMYLKNRQHNNDEQNRWSRFFPMLYTIVIIRFVRVNSMLCPYYLDNFICIVGGPCRFAGSDLCVSIQFYFYIIWIISHLYCWRSMSVRGLRFVRVDSMLFLILANSSYLIRQSEKKFQRTSPHFEKFLSVLLGSVGSGHFGHFIFYFTLPLTAHTAGGSGPPLGTKPNMKEM